MGKYKISVECRMYHLIKMQQVSKTFKFDFVKAWHQKLQNAFHSMQNQGLKINILQKVKKVNLYCELGSRNTCVYLCMLFHARN